VALIMGLPKLAAERYRYRRKLHSKEFWFCTIERFRRPDWEQPMVPSREFLALDVIFKC
jgi:hypothetical protein